MRQALLDKFTGVGYTVLQGADGEEGLQIALAQHPDIILLDILMPTMDGFSMLKKLREDAWGKDARVIILTNLDGLKDMSEILDLATFDYFVKAEGTLAELADRVGQRLKEAA